jgi:chemotaxis methyl-accepting protein methylase
MIPACIRATVAADDVGQVETLDLMERPPHSRRMDAAADSTLQPPFLLPLPPTRLRDAPVGPVAGEAPHRHHGVMFEGIRPSRPESRPAPPVERVVLRPMKSEAREDARFVHWLLARAGLDGGHYRQEPLLRRLPALLRALRVDTVDAAAELLRSKPMLVAKALDSLLIGTTEWFRDAAVFERLEREILPDLMLGGRAPRVWSAGSSDGLELYSVAMLLARLGGLPGSHLLGSDCRAAAIERASGGTYPGRPLPEGLESFYREDGPGTVVIAPELRRAVRWELADVMAADPARTWDLILCRNLAIYLEPAAVERLWYRLAAALAPGGYLIVGKAERPSLPGLLRTGPSIYRKCTRPIHP